MSVCVCDLYTLCCAYVGAKRGQGAVSRLTCPIQSSVRSRLFAEETIFIPPASTNGGQLKFVPIEPNGDAHCPLMGANRYIFCTHLCCVPPFSAISYGCALKLPSYQHSAPRTRYLRHINLRSKPSVP